MQLLLIIFYTSSVFLFIGICVLGLCISCMFPSMLAFTEDILDYKGTFTHTHTLSACNYTLVNSFFVFALKVAPQPSW